MAGVMTVFCVESSFERSLPAFTALRVLLSDVSCIFSFGDSRLLSPFFDSGVLTWGEEFESWAGLYLFDGVVGGLNSCGGNGGDPRDL